MEPSESSLGMFSSVAGNGNLVGRYGSCGVADVGASERFGSRFEAKCLCYMDRGSMEVVIAAGAFCVSMGYGNCGGNILVSWHPFLLK